MSIVRIERYSRFTNVPNETIEDDRLSFRARGVLVYLLSKPDHWTAKSAQLVTEGKEGRDAIRTALNELETYGYLERSRERVDHGRIVTVTVIRDLPKTGFQASVDQASGNQASTANTEQQTLSSNRRKKTSSSPSRTQRRSSIDPETDQSTLADLNKQIRPGMEPQPVADTPRVKRERKHQEEHIHAPLRRNADGLACYWCVELVKVGSLEPSEEAIVRKYFRAWLDKGLPIKLGRQMVDAFFADLELADSTHRWKRFVANAEKLRQRVLVDHGGVVVPGVDYPPKPFAWIDSLPPALREVALSGEDVA